MSRRSAIYKVEKAAYQGDGSDERTSVVASHGRISHVDGSLDTVNRGFVFLVMHPSDLEKGSKGGDPSGDYYSRPRVCRTRSRRCSEEEA